MNRIFVDEPNSYSKFVSKILSQFFTISPTSKVGVYFSSSSTENLKEVKILVLEHGNFVFKDLEKINKIEWDLVISPRNIEFNAKKLLLKSFYEEFILTKYEIPCQSYLAEEIVYCSQPLKEDKRNIGYEQIQLERFIEEILRKNNIKRNLLVRVHPREDRAKYFKYDKPIEDLLPVYSTWIGHSSMILYGAKACGHNAIIIENEFQLDENLEKFIISRLKTRVNQMISRKRCLEEIIQQIKKFNVEDREY
ncbi:hypothetical protein [Bacteriovorax sp. Seq25_V]|uniref:hypothetical protein n=1 Tax=Bacteriovorax sp. Seq25_V TaxID=1201288 RepID=UPI00038A4096|nr:hypothetical protein [Bacteriovorax sp. Seq25_V]EQC43246.1 hypothetical protein M900_0065 [Bacteriovorax sp. Seq25_V]